MEAGESGIWALSVVNRPIDLARTRFVILRCYVDESYREGANFTIAGIFSTGLDWARFESKWQRLLRRFNRELRGDGRPPISRFHSADLSSLRGEFAGWTPERRTAFMRLMLSSFRGQSKAHRFGILAYSVSLPAFFSVFPEWALDGDAWRRVCYFLTVKTMLMDFVSFFEAEKRRRLGDSGEAVVRAVGAQLIFDRCRWSAAIKGGYEAAIADARCRETFIAITEATWLEAVPLQAADLAAYEIYKEADRRRSVSARGMRRSLLEMAGMSEFAGYVGELGEEELRAIRRDAEGGGVSILALAGGGGN